MLSTKQSPSSTVSVPAKPEYSILRRGLTLPCGHHVHALLLTSPAIHANVDVYRPSNVYPLNGLLLRKLSLSPFT